jgi:hypothetical protein
LILFTASNLRPHRQTDQESAGNAQFQQANQANNKIADTLDGKRADNQRASDAEARPVRTPNPGSSDRDFADDAKADCPALFGPILYPGAKIANIFGIVDRNYPAITLMARGPMSDVVAYYQRIAPNGESEDPANPIYQTKAVRPGDNRRVQVIVHNNASFIQIDISVDNGPAGQQPFASSASDAGSPPAVPNQSAPSQNIDQSGTDSSTPVSPAQDPQQTGTPADPASTAPSQNPPPNVSGSNGSQ